MQTILGRFPSEKKVKKRANFCCSLQFFYNNGSQLLKIYPDQAHVFRPLEALRNAAFWFHHPS